MRIQRGGLGVQIPPMKNHKILGFLSNSGIGPLKNCGATGPAFNVGPSLACQRKAIEMAFRWQADDGPLIVLFGSTYLSSAKKKRKKVSKLNPLWQNFLDSCMGVTHYILRKSMTTQAAKVQ